MSGPTVGQHIQFAIQWKRGCFEGVEQPTCKINQLTPTTAEGKNDWSCIRDENRDNLSFHF
jgi:hypothetical protein